MSEPLTKEDIIRSWKAIGDHSNEEADRLFNFDDLATGREFQISCFQKNDEDNYFLSEILPNGRSFSEGKEGLVFKEEPIVLALLEETLLFEREPINSLKSSLVAAGIDLNCLVYSGAGFASNSMYYQNKEDCAQAILDALVANQVYCSTRELSSSEVAAQAAKEAHSSYQYWEGQYNLLQASKAYGAGLFKGCSDMLGQPLTAAATDAILSYINRPTQEAWEDIRGLLVAGNYTLWKTWCESDDTAPRVGSDRRHPGAETVQELLRLAVEYNQASITERYEAAKKNAPIKVVKCTPEHDENYPGMSL